MLFPVILTIVLFIVGLTILSLASDYLVIALVKFAQVVGFSPFVVGAVILSIANSLPELSNNLMAGIEGVMEIGLGNQIGGAITNVTLACGIVLLMIGKKKEKVERSENETFLFALVAIGLIFLFGRDGRLARWEGAILLAGFALYQFILFKRGVHRAHKHIILRRLVFPYALVPLAILSIIIGAFLVVDTATIISALVNIPVAVIGLTVVSIGTSLPDISTGINAVRKGYAGLAFGNTFGAVVVDLMFSLGLVVTIFSMPVNFHYFVLPLIMLAGSIILFAVYINLKKQTSRWLGASFIGIYAFYLIINFLMI